MQLLLNYFGCCSPIYDDTILHDLSTVEKLNFMFTKSIELLMLKTNPESYMISNYLQCIQIYVKKRHQYVITCILNFSHWMATKDIFILSFKEFDYF